MPSNYAIKVDEVSKVYNTGGVEVRALDGVSFSLKRGEFAAIVGPSGSGKSTLMNVMGTLDKPTRGEVYIEGVATSKMTGNQLADFRSRKLGFVFQAFNLMNNMTAQMNVELPMVVTGVPEAKRREMSAKMLTGLGLEKRLKMKPTSLSGGEQQRVGIARALVNNPALILADEPTGDLDTKSGDEVVRLLRKICDEREVTIVMVTHNTDTTKYCDRVIYVRDGKIEREVKIR